jgi:hypothetical protein
MKIKEINVEVSYLKALPNYSNVRFVSGCTATLKDGDNEQECYQKLWDMCGDEINKQLSEFDSKNK